MADEAQDGPHYTGAESVSCVLHPPVKLPKRFGVVLSGLGIVFKLGYWDTLSEVQEDDGAGQGEV